MIRKLVLLSAVWLMIIMPVVAFSKTLNQMHQVGHSAFEMGMYFPWRFVEQMINAEEKFESEVEGLGIPIEDASIVLPKLHFKSQISSTFVGAAGPVTEWRTELKDLQLEFAPWQINQKVIKIIQGVRVVINLQGDCDRIVVRLPNVTTKSKIIWATNKDKITAHIDSLDIEVNPSEISTLPFQCRGPNGLADLIQTEFRRWTSQSEKIESLLIPEVTKKLNSTMDTTLETFRKSVWQNGFAQQTITAKYLGQELISERGFLFKGAVGLNRAILEGENLGIPLELSEEDLEKIGEHPTMIVNKGALQSFLLAAVANFSFQGDLTKIQSFQDLLKSRFMQLFVWPDLWSFGRRSKFPVKVENVDLPSLTLGRGGEMSLKGVLHTTVECSREKKDQEYFRLQSSIQARMNLTINNGHLKASVRNKKLKSKVVFSSDYVERYQPSTYVATHLIDDVVQNMGIFQEPEIDMPVLNINNHLQLIGTGLSTDDPTFVFVKWSLQKR